MKKRIGMILVLVLLLPVLAGCQRVGATLNPSSNGLTKEEALEIALKDAGLTKDEIRNLKIELDREISRTHYDVDFEKDNRDYDYEIDAQTGNILHREIEQD